MSSEAAKTSEDNGRDPVGRFAAGNRFASGRVSRREREKKYLAAFDQALSSSDLEAVVTALLERAKSGSVAACRVLLDHTVGRPVIRLEMDVDVEEYRVAGVSPAEHMSQMMARIQQKVQAQREYEARLAAAGVEFGRNADSQSNDG